MAVAKTTKKITVKKAVKLVKTGKKPVKSSTKKVKTKK